MDKPTNVVCTNIAGGVRVTWDEGTTLADKYEVYVSVSNGAYSKVGTVNQGVKRFDDTQAAGLSLKYKVIGVGAKNYSLPARSKYDYTNYTIEPLICADGSKMHVETQRDNIVFASKTGYVMWSTNKGIDFTSVAFTDADKIVYSHIFSNGNVLFATYKNELWLGKSGLTSMTQKYLKNRDGSNFVYHTPVNASYPGIYFRSLSVTPPTWQEGIEVLVFGNYAMYNMAQMLGATPSMVFDTQDCGETIKVSYRFGHEGVSGSRDDGTQFGSASAGNPLGDLTNSIAIQHIHYVIYDQYTNEWFVSCGELGLFLKGIWNLQTDTWSWSLLLNNPGMFYRGSGMIVTPTHYILMSDSGTLEYQGIWKCLKADFTDYTKFTKIATVNTPLAPCVIYGDKAIGGHWNSTLGAVVSLDGGITWNDYPDIPISESCLTIIGYPNSDGGFRSTPYNWTSQSPYGRQSYLLHFK